MSLPCPIPYQGSKRKLAPAIVKCLPADTVRLFEPFCGSAAVSVAAAMSRQALTEIVLNDKNAPLAGLWERILEDPDAVATRYEKLWNQQLDDPRGFYDETRDEFNRTHEPVLLLYLLARCVKAAVRYNGKGEFNQSPDNRRLGSRPERMRSQLRAVSRTLAGRTTVSSLDFVEAVERATPLDVIYMDPPYQGTSTNRDRRYADILSLDRFTAVLEEFVSRNLSFIVSYDGKTGSKQHGQKLPDELGLHHVEVALGRSTQATFLGRDDITVESLYFSPALVERLGAAPTGILDPPWIQSALI